ncbi:hypothetical protein LZ32DRAFT_289867 [Colletotrichum eremochloae]|nr:hypothetical protein LZ32DRAFT_289867 [Colletotrichum eremochloae]
MDTSGSSLPPFAGARGGGGGVPCRFWKLWNFLHGGGPLLDKDADERGGHFGCKIEHPLGVDWTTFMQPFPWRNTACIISIRTYSGQSTDMHAPMRLGTGFAESERLPQLAPDDARLRLCPDVRVSTRRHGLVGSIGKRLSECLYGHRGAELGL